MDTHLAELTAVVTNFHRPRYLERCLDSIVRAGHTRISVFSMVPQDDVKHVISKFQSNPSLDFRYNSLPFDLGLHETWGLASYFADTKYVCLYHDDDCSTPEFGRTYEEIIYPSLLKGVGFASWRANLLFNSGRTQATEYWGGPTRVLSSSELESFLLRPKRLSLSPIISVFNRQTLIHAIKEGSHALTDYLHPGMLLGTEVLVYLRHCSEFREWLYIDRVMSQYGSHNGSGTVQYQNSNNISRLSNGYDQARNYYSAHRTPPTSYEPRILLLSVPFESQDEAERARFANARRTWTFHFNQGTMLDFPIKEGAFERSSKDIGDTAWVPFLKDIFDYGCKFAMSEDVIAYSNLDLGFTTTLPDQVIAKVKECGVCVIWRRTMPFTADIPLRTCKNGNRDGGVDFIAMSPQWWQEHREHLPEMFTASNHWDFVIRVYAERATNGQCYLSDGGIHQPHDSFFSRHKMDNVRQKHNHAAAREFFHSIGDHKIVQIIDRGQLKG